jgi:hypothetical protein
MCNVLSREPVPALFSASFVEGLDPGAALDPDRSGKKKSVIEWLLLLLRLR